MPGPGGGSRGGGGGFGGSRGGGFGGGFGGGPRPGGFGGGPRPGGFGGGHHHHHHHHHPHFGWGWRFGGRRYYGGGGGCFGALMTPIFISVFLIFFLIYALLPSGNTNDTYVGNYDEAAMQASADRVYAQCFESGATYEDNILLYVLVDEDCKKLCYIAWVGDNIVTDVSDLFGNDYTELGHAIYSNVPEYYSYSIDSNLAAVVEDMGAIIEKMELSSCFKKAPASAAKPSDSKLVDLRVGEDAGKLPSLTASTVNGALEEFTEKTGIRLVIAVDYIDNVFGGEGLSGDTIMMIGIIVIILIVIIVVSVSSAKNRKKRNAAEEGEPENRYKDDH